MIVHRLIPDNCDKLVRQCIIADIHRTRILIQTEKKIGSIIKHSLQLRPYYY